MPNICSRCCTLTVDFFSACVSNFNSKCRRAKSSRIRDVIYYRRFLAVPCIMVVVVVWLAMAELVQDIQAEYPKPFFLTLFAHGAYIVCFVPWLLWRFGPLCKPENDNYVGYFNWCYYFGASIPIGFAAFVSGWLWYLSLPRTSVSGNTAIYQSSCTMVYVFSVIILHEKVTRLKTVSVIASVIGVFLVSFAGTKAPPETAISDGPVLISHAHPSFWGYLLCLMSMILYALFEVFYKRWASHSADTQSIMNSVRFLGLLGASTILFFAPLLLVFDWFGWEEFELPTKQQGEVLVLLGLLDSAFNLFLILAIMLSTPLFASIGCLLVLPASLIFDHIAHNFDLPAAGLIGIAFIGSGFIGFLIEEFKPAEAKETLFDYEVVTDNTDVTRAESPINELPAVKLNDWQTAPKTILAEDKVWPELGVEPDVLGRTDDELEMEIELDSI